MIANMQIVQVSFYFLFFMPFFAMLLSPGVLVASLLAKQWRGAVNWNRTEYLFAVPVAAAWYFSFAWAPGKTWANLALEPLLVGFAASIYVLIRRYWRRGRFNYAIALTVWCGSAMLIARAVPMVPCAE